jgi:hypothetical protein
MGHYLSLDLENLVLDWALMAHLPLDLARYYLALPLASEDGIVSVAMAYPQDGTALAVLADVLDAPVVPVRAPAAAIRRALDDYQTVATPCLPRVLAWSNDDRHTHFVSAAATRFATALAAAMTLITAQELDLDGVLSVARAGQYALTVVHLPAEVEPSLLLPHAPAPLLLLRNGLPHLERVLIALRGYSADEQILNWLAPLLSEGMTVTLMPVARPEAGNHLPLLVDEVADAHLRACLQHPALRDARAFVKFRQGQIVHQIVQETEEGNYDLVVIAAEGNGYFVGRILAAIEQQAAGRHSFFILKPPTCLEPRVAPYVAGRARQTRAGPRPHCRAPA